MIVKNLLQMPPGGHTPELDVTILSSNCQMCLTGIKL